MILSYIFYFIVPLQQETKTDKCMSLILIDMWELFVVCNFPVVELPVNFFKSVDGKYLKTYIIVL